MLLWAAQAISQTAQNAVWFGLLVLVQTRSHSSVHMSLAVATLILPSVIFGLLAGAYVDRRDKRWVLIGTNAVRALVVLGYVLFADLLALVYVTNFVFATIGQFFAPAEAAMIPAIVERRRLIQANSLFHLTFTASQLGGLVLLGPLVVNLWGLDALFIVVALALAICAVILWPLPSTHRRVEHQVSGITGLVAEVREVLGFVRGDRVLSRTVAQWTLGATLAIIVATLAPAYVVDVVGVRAEDGIFVLAPAGLGMVLGTAVLSRWGAALDRRRLIDVGIFSIGLAIAFLSVVGPLWTWLFAGSPAGARAGWDLHGLVALVMVASVLAGLAFVAVVVPTQTIIQERAPAEIRGRVFAVQLVLSNLVGIIPLLFLAEAADLIGVDWTLMGLGVALLGLGLWSARASQATQMDASSEAERDSAA